MDIYSAENHVKKLLSYIQDLDANRPNMRQPSINRLTEIANSCSTIIHIIGSILQDEMLSQECEEFESPSAKIVETTVSSIEGELNSLKRFTGQSKTRSISPADCKLVIRTYGQVLRRVSEVDLGYDSVNRCSDILWSWFNSRFFLNTNPQFKYDVYNVHNWVRDIVVSYSSSLVSGDADRFISEFTNWCKSLSTSPTGNRFALPYPIYRVGQSPNVSDATLTSAVIWDILLDGGLNALCTTDPFDPYLNADSVFQFCVSLYPESLNDYVDYKQDSRVLKIAGVI